MRCMKIFIYHLLIILLVTGFSGIPFAFGSNVQMVKEPLSSGETKTKESALTVKESKTPDVKAEPAALKKTPTEGELKAAAKAEEQDMMEQALVLLQSSHEYWVKGDVENALEMLDQAYALILDTNGEPDIARQKDDLRLLISKRILSIYSAMQTVTTGKKSEIPLIINADVEKEIRSFQSYERDFFISSYQRSFMYRPMILKELKKAGLPEELSWLPLVESGFKIAALSKARALGLWQFIPSTGYKYALDRDDWIDERLDAEKSTRAAIAYLKELHGMFGDWLTVLAAYNCGEGRVMRVISRQHINYLDRFWDLYHQLPNETARYVPRFLATIHIIKDPKKYGMELDNGVQKMQPLPYEIVKTEKTMRLQDIAEHLNVSEDILNILNTELRLKITPERIYDLKIPPDTKEKFAGVVDDIPRWEKPIPKASYKARPVMISHRVRKGETVTTIARKYRISAKSIRASNRLSSKKDTLQAGQYLTIPMSSSKIVAKKAVQEDTKQNGSNVVRNYKVKKGDTLASIADKFNLSVAEIKEMNKMKSGKVKTGQIIRVAQNNSGSAAGQQDGNSDKKSSKKKGGAKNTASGKEKSAGKTYIVKKGDSLYRIASNHSIKVQRLQELNHLPSKKTALKEGQVLVIE
ncbi:MAG: hypothetical protein CSYNP_03524 [Syntrophus sp. SKADARSKE-3]|nr:hypothetical protein [Syntrophus sp. SKADARSKE-3]